MALVNSDIINIKKRGAFILFEGCDKAGKSTQANKLFEYLRNNGHSVELLKFPDRKTKIGQIINAYLANEYELDDKAIHLLFSVNRWERMKAMKNLLLSGKTLIVDRYAYSGVSYSAAKGLDLNWCCSPDIGLLSPDVIFFMDLTAEEAEKRGGFGEERYEKKSLQEKVRKIFYMLKEKDSDKDSLWRILNANQSVELLHKRIVEYSLKLIEKCSQLPLKEDLWKATS
ncbi:dTMP kinase [Glomus cerebriforme]|uniref:Thymidylate kinase n=1 Tax=Glomus cerebriforme TaxID=658196 RepID=A0A397TB98_9GLOM|nr:dTMP kinase [Glomus cerebriforme]